MKTDAVGGRRRRAAVPDEEEKRDRFAIDLDQGADVKVQGSVVDHEYQIERDGDRVAQISKHWFRVRDTNGVEVEQGEDVGLVWRSPSPWSR